MLGRREVMQDILYASQERFDARDFLCLTRGW